jgi:hypothetical protein
VTLHRCRTLLVLVLAALTACATPTAAVAMPGRFAGTVSLPPANARFDYQIGGAYPPAAGVGIVDRDWHDAPASTGYGICYLNAFQTQTEDFAWWQANHPDLLLRDAAGTLVIDSVWNEVLLDLRTAAKRSALAAIVGGWLDQCAAKGYRGAEFDNLDTYTRSHNLLSYPQNRAYAALLVARAHADGLAAAQKNTVDRSADLKAVAGFDFAIVEECQVYSECGSATSVYGNQVYEVEYPDNGGLPNYQRACAARGARISGIWRDRDVVPRGAPGYTYRDC